MNPNNSTLYILLFLLISICSCNNDKSQNPDAPVSDTGFTLEEIPSAHSGVTFANNIRENQRLHYFLWNFIYQGAGVSVGDINNDGLNDIYFSGNMESDKLYLNKGNFQFEDISTTAGIVDKLWSTGVTMVDVNADGLLDIYVCKNFFLLQESVRKNKLFINNGDLTFTEQAEQYGIADPGYSVQSYFFDPDNDGDLDMYLVNQPMDQYAAKLAKPETLLTLPFSDKYYQNENGRYIDKTEAYQLKNRKYGLSAVTADFDLDGWTDLYVCNDYKEGDQLMMNKGKGQFKNEIHTRIDHSSFYSMGSDVADINNDGALDFITLDMAFGDHYRSKTNMESMQPELFWQLVNQGEHYQYAVNNLHVNSGHGYFSETAHYSEIAKTDWSWAALFEDMDNDGLQDLLVSNGLLKDLRNNDFLVKMRQELKGAVSPDEIAKVTASIPSTPVNNIAYRNRGKLKFEDVSEKAGFGKAGFSSGMATADLDNDGDMDVVINNSNHVASIFKNTSKNNNNWIKIRLKGKHFNPQGIGARVSIYYQDKTQTAMMNSSRGYMSSCPAVIHFGIGKASSVDSVVVQWDHLQSSIIGNPSLNEEILVDYRTTRRMHISDIDAIELVTDEKLIDFRHIENEIDEYKEQVLLPHKISQNGPFIEVFDANGDELEDVFIGGAKGQPGSVFFQTDQGGFNKSEQPALNQDKNFEDMEASSFDFDGDGDLDLYVVSGGHEFASGNKEIVDRLYLNDGKGNFSANQSIELSRLESQAAVIIDLNNDQKNDFFIGGRGIPGSYPLPESSELYLSSGQEYLKTTFDSLGMVTDVVSADIDGDNDMDLILVGEWMPITLMINNFDGFRKEEIDINNKSSRSWWWRVEKGDFDNDGDIDFLLGNLGLNNKFKPSAKKPFQVFSDDFDSSGDQDVVLAKVIGDELFPVRGRECSSEEMPFISEKFQSFDAFAKATLNEILTDEKLDSSLHYKIYDFKSIYLENLGNLQFESHPLPYQVQLGPVKDFVVSDLNKDGKLDFIFAGNHYPVEVETVRYDGSKGGICLGDGQGNFEFQGPASTGLYINCDSRDMELIDIKGEKYLLVSCNDDYVKTLRLNHLR